MQVKTEAIVIHSIRYGEADLIVKLYTKKEGINSYLVRGILKSKKANLRASFFQPLSLLEIDAIHNTKNSLFKLKEAKPSIHYQNIHTNIIKGGVVSFISEILTQVLENSETDNNLFQFLNESFIWLDNSINYSLFNQLFLLKLTYFLGFYPDTSNIFLPQFNLSEGNFDVSSKSPYCISNNELNNFKSLLGINFDDLEKITIPKIERLKLIDNLLLYYSLHIEGFKKPKSLTVLKGLFN